MSSQAQATKFLVVILHRSELLADAAMLGQHVTSRLADGGWKSTHVLQNLDSWDPIISPLGEEHLHLLLVVMTGYIRTLKPQAVHGHEADNISELLAVSRRHVKQLLSFVRTCQAVMICSGKNLPYSEEARALEIEMDGLLDCHHVFVSWNLRGFNAEAWGQLVADLGQVTLEGVDQALERVISTLDVEQGGLSAF